MESSPQTKYFEQLIDEKPIDQQINEWVDSYKEHPKKLKPVIITQPVINVTSIQVEKGVFEPVRNCTIQYLELSEFALQQMAMRGQMPGQA